jgi:hypothetical protein
LGISKSKGDIAMQGKITIFAIFVFIVSFFPIEAKVVDWKYVGTGESALHYYDPQSIKWVSKDIVRVWVKISYRGKGVQRHIKKFGPEYKKLSYSISIWEFNCSEGKRNLVESTDYKQDGGVIHSYAYDSPSWHFITPDSMNEKLFNIVCGSR